MRRLRHNNREKVGRIQPARKGFFSRIKEKFAILTGIGVCACAQMDEAPPEAKHPDILQPGKTESPFDVNMPLGKPTEEQCTAFPEIEEWADKRDLDPMLVRAFILTESDFDHCAAAKVCGRGHEDIDCREAGPAEDKDYEKGYGAMHDPDGTCLFDNSSGEKWRWLGLGAMQTVVPPYTFWPSVFHPEKIDGEYNEAVVDDWVYRFDIKEAEKCNTHFNPFNIDDSVCLGTAKMQKMLEQAKNWIKANRHLLNWSAGDLEKDRAFAVYILAHKYLESWDGRAETTNAQCSSTLTSAECWMRNFELSWTIDREYCFSRKRDNPPLGCSSFGVPDKSKCYGYTDPIVFMRECEIPHLIRPVDVGEVKLAAYYWLKNGCRN